MLITRPQPQADRLAADLSAALSAAVCPVVSPLMETEFFAAELPEGPFSAVIVTSEAGARAAGYLKRTGVDLPEDAFCVGEKTADHARSAGFHTKIVEASATALLDAVVASGASGPLLYLRGKDISMPIDKLLSEAGIPTRSAIAYAQNALPLSVAAQALLAIDGPVIVPLFSARSARLFFNSLPPGAVADLRVCLIAENVREVLPVEHRGKAVLAESPDGKSMIAAIVRVISSLSP